MDVEVLLTEGEIAQEFAEAIEARDLPEKFFYWSALSVQAWTAVAKSPLYQGLARSWAGLAADPEVIAQFKSPVSVISLGAGDGSRDRLFIEALRGARRAVKYFPVDASLSLIEAACSSAEEADIEVQGIKADISSPVHLVLASDAAESPKVFLMSGNTLGAFDPLDQIRRVAQSLHSGDRLIVDGELLRPDTVAAHDALETKAFAFAPLVGVGITGEDGVLRFEQKRDERQEGLHLITRNFKTERDVRITTLANEIEIPRGERISLNFNYLYTPQAFRWLLSEHGGLKIQTEFPSPDGRFITAVCVK
jgi:uncharacterized SAM-dependent methyltransferase